MVGLGNLSQDHCRYRCAERKITNKGGWKGFGKQKRMKGLINYWLPVIVWMGGIYWGSSLSVLPGPLSSSSWQAVLLRKTVHLAEYAVLATLLWCALRSTCPAQTKVQPATLWSFPVAFVIALLYAVFDEWHQSLVPGREARLLDVGIDMVGVVVALGLIWWRSALK